MTTITNAGGTRIDFDAARELMDDELCDQLHHGEGADTPDTEQQFFDLYCRLHRDRFGEEFEPNKRNPVW